MRQWNKNFWWVSWSVLFVAQIVLCVLFYNRAGLYVLTYAVWGVLAVGFVIGNMGVTTLRRQGRAREGESWIKTTTLVETGIYAVVRHPQYLCWVLASLAMMLLSQHWLVAIIGGSAAATIYMQARQDDQSLIKKFGEDYKRYMRRVPRMNLVVGVIRLIVEGVGERG